MMKKLTAILVAVLCILASTVAFAQYDGQYIIPNSDTRRLTEAELWEYEYDTLGYVLNEIFARHGYHFQRGGKYDQYFRSTDWYQENTRYATNQEIYAHEISSIEWANESLVKKVREDMRARHTKNPSGLSLEEALSGTEPYNRRGY